MPGGFPMRPGRNQETKKCSTHGKKRTVKNLEQNDEGLWVCRPGSECRKAPPASSDNESTETAMCTLHDKERTIANLGKNQNGEWVCLGSSLCKSGGNGYRGGYQGQQWGGWNPGYGGGPFCMLHGKKRTMQNLVRNQVGELVCRPGSQCKGASGVDMDKYICKIVPGSGAAPDLETCTVHNKKRTTQNLKQNEFGEWVCIKGSICK